LGPEETGAAGVWVFCGPVPVAAVAVAGSGVRPFLENCTVDASISCFLRYGNSV